MQTWQDMAVRLQPVTADTSVAIKLAHTVCKDGKKTK